MFDDMLSATLHPMRSAVTGVVGRRSLLIGAGALVAAAALTAGCAAPQSGGVGDPVAEWIGRTAVPLDGVDAADPLQLPPVVRDALAGASVIGLGESAHGLGDQFTVRHRIVRYLVEELGFRTLAWEADYASGVAVDRYVVDGVGDPRTIVGSMLSAWQSEQMLALVEWMREYNRGHPEKVRFLGTDLTQLRRSSLDEITRFVAETAPDRLAELTPHLAEIELRGTAGEHVGWYYQQPDKERLIAHARAVRDLVASLPGAPNWDEVRRHAEAILGFYTHYAQDNEDFRDRFMADSLIAWQQRTGHKAVFWGANVHVAAAEQVEYAFPPTVSHATLVPVGQRLRQRFGAGYLAVAATFGAGEVLQGFETGEPRVYQVPPPRAGTTDDLFDRALPEIALIDLRTPGAPTVVREWLAGPAELRLIGAAYDPAIDDQYAMTVAALSSAFDAVVHVRRSGPARLLT